jgi:hypothetical protein
VTDVADIHVFQIGNITWDQIGSAEPVPPVKQVPAK